MSFSNSETVDLNSICRACLISNSSLKSIFKCDPFLDLPALFKMCTDVEVSNTDGLPSQMCEQCFVKLQSFRDFRNLCRNSDNYLKLFISRSAPNINNNEFSEHTDEVCIEADPDFWSYTMEKKNNGPLAERKLSLDYISNQNDNPMDEDDDNQNTKTKKRKDVSNTNRTHIKDKSLLLTKRKRTKFKGTLKQKKDVAQCLTFNIDVSNFNKVEKNEFICNICGKNTSNKDDLKKHKYLHYSYTCKICQTKFKNMQYFRAHNCEGLKHDETISENLANHGKAKNSQYLKMLICHMCELEFKNITRLQYHIRSHTGEKPALCTWCGKGFREQRGLINHIRAVHTGEKRFKCSFCPKAFPVSGKRKQHERIHTGEKPYQCDLCNRLFAAKTTLNTHRRIHTGENKFQCKVQGCNQGFYAFSTYQRHMWAHRGERPYPCLECNKTYLSAQNLRSHVKAAHTKLRDEICHMCGKGFTEKSVLNRHLRKIHNTEPKDNRPIPAYGSAPVNPNSISDLQ